MIRNCESAMPLGEMSWARAIGWLPARKTARLARSQAAVLLQSQRLRDGAELFFENTEDAQATLARKTQSLQVKGRRPRPELSG